MSDEHTQGTSPMAQEAISSGDPHNQPEPATPQPAALAGASAAALEERVAKLETRLDGIEGLTNRMGRVEKTVEDVDQMVAVLTPIADQAAKEGSSIGAILHAAGRQLLGLFHPPPDVPGSGQTR